LFSNPDLHIHSTFSDGTDSPEELLKKVKESGVDVFALTDHDEYKGCDIIKGLLRPGDPAFIYGIEFSCRDESGKYHILGYAYDTENSEVTRLCDHTRQQRRTKLEARLEFLRQNGYCLSEESIARLRSVNNCGKPHIVNELEAAGLIKERAEGFEIINRRREETGFVTPEEAIRAINASNGISVLAHTPYGDGRDMLTEAETEERIVRLKQLGLMGVECGYSTYTTALGELMQRLADKHRLLVTAGSDYHGKNKKHIKIGDNGKIDAGRLEGFLNAAIK